MEDISELLLGPQRASVSAPGIVLAAVAVLLGVALMGYLVWCYVRERRIKKRIAQRVRRPYGGNIVPVAQVLSKTKRLPKKSSRTLPAVECDDNRVRRRRHPWKRGRFDAPTPH